MKKLQITLAATLILFINGIFATNLLDVFHQAQKADPTYQKAKATYLSARTQLEQSRAKLLPTLDLTGTWGHSNVDTNNKGGFGGAPAGETKAKGEATDTSLTLTQPLFNWAAFKAYDAVKLNVKQAAATYAAAEQDLITRTATAYFDTLQAQDNLYSSAAQRRQLARALQVARQRYHVGLDAITAVYSAQSSYDTARAGYIADENTLANKKEALRQITGEIYASLDDLKQNIPLMRPTPENINQWTTTAENQNLTLLAARFAAQSAREVAKAKFAQHLPTIDLNASYDDTNTTNVDNTSAKQDLKTTAYGVKVTAPIFAGGATQGAARQADYDYQTAVAAMEIAHRQTIADTRTAYLGVVATISQIVADRQAIKSAKASLESNEAGYRVGTQTILDVLTAQSTLYTAQTTYTKDRFAYVNNTLALKQAAGILSEDDLRLVNSWLGKNTRLKHLRRAHFKKSSAHKGKPKKTTTRHKARTHKIQHNKKNVHAKVATKPKAKTHAQKTIRHTTTPKTKSSISHHKKATTVASKEKAKPVEKKAS